ncbi:hypothetical protein [Paracidovorax valerianellae]|uniref:hypothetical protein n=1 Tax=Paracidovorax valerianellae TaxID=187868 RepID=UPI002304C828|nr:hypothetical protein [Paracidovorax valerianellae]MDA8444793.1 hypothetical protein [Paracidovorax valerianellae]
MGAHGGSASLGGDWMTPNVPNGGRCLSPELVASKGRTANGEKKTVGLESQARHWMTPSVSNSQGNEYTRDRGMPGLERLTLTGQAQNWPTPASRDYRTPNSEASQVSRTHTGGEQLPNFVEHHFSHPVLSTLDGRPLSPTARTLPRRLNPAFGCWLMGWPIWWTNPALTNCVRSEMELYRCRLQLHLSNLCGVLPLEGKEA